MESFEAPSVARAEHVLDSEIQLQRVYVGGGLTSPQVAALALTGAAVRARGDLWSATALWSLRRVGNLPRLPEGAHGALVGGRSGLSVAEPTRS